jgi:hypothetical protein
MIFTEQQIGRAMERAMDVFHGHAQKFGAAPEQIISGTMMAALLLTELGLKNGEEGIRPALDRLHGEPKPYDFLNETHRQAVALMLQQMFEPLGVFRIFLIALTPEHKTFITDIARDGVENLSIEQMRGLLLAVAEDDDAEWML